MKKRTMLVAFVAAVATMALVNAAVAIADDTVVNDPTGDSVSPHPDIVQAVAGVSDGGKLQHTIRTDSVFADPEAPCLAIREVYPSTTDLYVCHDGKIRKVSNDSVVADATVTRPDNHSVRYTFTRKAIDKSTAYRWQAQVQAPGCDHGTCDAAPDNFILREEIVTYEDWANGFLGGINAPTCKQNRTVMLAWEANEGTAAVFNPLATTYVLPGSTKFNTSGVRNYVSLAQGVKGTRLTLENGAKSYGYQPILDRLQACAPPLYTAKAIRASSWCSGCSGGRYVTGLIDDVQNNYQTYADRLIATYPQTRAPDSIAEGIIAARNAGNVPA